MFLVSDQYFSERHFGQKIEILVKKSKFTKMREILRAILVNKSKISKMLEILVKNREIVEY